MTNRPHFAHIHFTLTTFWRSYRAISAGPTRPAPTPLRTPPPRPVRIGSKSGPNRAQIRSEGKRSEGIGAGGVGLAKMALRLLGKFRLYTYNKGEEHPLQYWSNIAPCRCRLPHRACQRGRSVEAASEPLPTQWR